MNQEHFYTPGEVAEKLRVTRDCVYKWIKAGKLPAQRPLPRVIRVSESDLAVFLSGKNATNAKK